MTADASGSRPARTRKVRTPQGRVPGNAWARQRDGQCNRKQTADGRVFGLGTGKVETVR
ncbi:MAG: hypothetical protein JWO69_940 [Thermoleophilia bacterium]|nr:hypothetical protein [Thermoleophilia bacterium]